MTTTLPLRRRNIARFTSGIRSVVVIVAAIIALLPIGLMLLTAVKTQPEVFANPVALPSSLHWDNFSRAWNVGGIAQKAGNSVVVTVASVLLSTICGAGAGYVAARIRPARVGVVLTTLFAFGLFLPAQSALVPLFTEMLNLGLLGTLWPIILVDTALQLPLTVVIFSTFFAAIPIDIEEAAFMDGASRLRVLRTIVFPLARPAIATSVILGAVATWNDYFVALIFSTDPSLQTLPVGLSAFKTSFSTDWPATLAYSAIIAIPIFVLYVALQKYITDGVSAGAVRG